MSALNISENLPARLTLTQLDRELLIDPDGFFAECDSDLLSDILLRSTRQEVQAYIERKGYTKIESAALLQAHDAFLLEDGDEAGMWKLFDASLGLNLIGRATTPRALALALFADGAMQCAERGWRH